MKKKSLSILLALLLVLSLAACGGSSGGDRYAGSDSASSESAASGSGWNGGSYDADMPEDPGASPGESGGTIPANTKIIYSADLSLETTEFDEAEQALDSLVDSLGGWFESRSIYQGGGCRSLHGTVRVPVTEFAGFLDRAGEAAHVTGRDEYAEDVSEAYYDQESRLVTQRTKLERLQQLLSQADAMEEIIALESAISDTELEIEQLTGSLRRYDSLVDYSTVTLRLQEVYQLSSVEPAAVTFGQRLGSAFSAGLSRGISSMQDFCIAFARNWVNLILLAAVIAAVILLSRRVRKVRKTAPRPGKKPFPPQPPEPAEPEEPMDKKE